MVICVTGQPFSGKTTALKIISTDLFFTNNFKFVSADEIITQIYKKNELGYLAIKNAFGDDFVNSNCVNREKLLETILLQENILNKLEKLIWPILKEKLEEVTRINKNVIIELAVFKNNPVFFKNIINKIIYIKRDYREIELSIMNKYKCNKNKAKLIFNVYTKSEKNFKKNIVIDNKDLLNTIYKLKLFLRGCL